MRKVLYIFGLLTDGDVEWLARTGRRRIVRDGEIVIREGRPVESIIAGELTFPLQMPFFIPIHHVSWLAPLAVNETTPPV